MSTEAIIANTKQMIDDLKTVCANFGLGNASSEYKIITEIFLYKFLNDKFIYEVQQADEELKNSENVEQALNNMSEDDYEMLMMLLPPATAKLKREHFISYLFIHKVKLQSAIANMSPKKFEQFSRALLTKMGVQFTDKGIKISNDGGIDGYGYHTDDDDFRTTRVVIQCKRYNTAPVSEPDINQFLGAMNKFQADYGVFITNSRFTNAAREAAREGTPITLIDGNDLVRLVIKYELYITPVTTYVLDDFYDEE